MFGYLAAALVGALAMFFLDPDRGAYRRNVTRDRMGGTARRGERQFERAGRKVAADAYGVGQKVTHLDADDKPATDAALTQKVMS